MSKESIRFKVTLEISSIIVSEAFSIAFSITFSIAIFSATGIAFSSALL